MPNVVDLRSPNRAPVPVRAAHDIAMPTPSIPPVPIPPTPPDSEIDVEREAFVQGIDGDVDARLTSAEHDILLEQLLASASPEPLSWEAPSPSSSTHQSRRYTLMAGLVILGGLISFWQSTWTVLVIALLGSGLWELRERLHGPARVAITERGVQVDGMHIPHAELTSFDIHRMSDGAHVLSLHTASWSAPRIRVSLGPVDPAHVHALLSQHVPQADHPLPLVDWFLHR